MHLIGLDKVLNSPILVHVTDFIMFSDGLEYDRQISLTSAI